MDLLDFDKTDLYFDEPVPEQVKTHLQDAAEAYSSGRSEQYLLRAHFLAPTSLMVLVALYRYYYYQHRHDDALTVAERAMALCAERLDFAAEWRELDESCIGRGATVSMGLLRFYLLALKGAGYLNLRLGDLDKGQAMLAKVVELDPQDRLGASVLLDVVERKTRLRVVS